MVVAASLGGLHALSLLLSELPGNFPAPVLVVRHVAARGPGLAPDLLGRHTPLDVREARTGDLPRPGHVYLAPPDWHLLVGRRGVISLSRKPRENFVRPAADPLFRAAAGAYGHRTLAVVLTGSGRDGAAGVAAVKAAGGVVVSQDPRTCEASGMPRAALETGCVDFVLPLGKIPAALTSLTMVPGAANLFGLPAA